MHPTDPSGAQDLTDASTSGDTITSPTTRTGDRAPSGACPRGPPSGRSRQRRRDLAREAPPAAEDDHLAGPADHPAHPVHAGTAGVPPRRAAGADPRREWLAAARGVLRLLPRLPAARMALGDPGARHRVSAQGPRLDRDHLHLLDRQLPRAGQARRHLPGLPPQDQQPGLAESYVRDRIHRARARPLHDRRVRPGSRLLELPDRHAGRDADPVRRRRRDRHRPGRCAADDAELRPAVDRGAAAAPQGHRVLRPVRGRRLRCPAAEVPAVARW